MPIITGATPHAQKIYDFLYDGGYMTPEKLQDADKITLGVKLSKGVVANLLLDLEKKGWVKRVARGKAAGYYITKVPSAESQVVEKGDGEFTADDIF